MSVSSVLLLDAWGRAAMSMTVAVSSLGSTAAMSAASLMDRRAVMSVARSSSRSGSASLPSRARIHVSSAGPAMVRTASPAPCSVAARLSSSMMFRVVVVMVFSPFCVFCFLTFFGQRMRTPRKAVPS